MPFESSAPTIGDLLRRFGAALELVDESDDAGKTEVRSVAFFDEEVESARLAGSVVLMIRVAATDPDTPEFIASLKGAAAAVLRKGDAVPQAVVAAARTAGIFLLLVRAAVPWGELAFGVDELIRDSTAVDADDQRGSPLGGVPLGDITALCNALAGMTTQSFAILDPDWRLLGYSSLGTAPTDALQREVILAQRVPNEQARAETRRELFGSPAAQRFWTGAVGERPDGLVWRIGMGVRDRGGPLGMVWALVGSDEPSQGQLDVVTSYGPVVASHLARLREVRTTERARTGHLVELAITAGDPSALRSLGLAASDGVCVTAIAPPAERATAAMLDGLSVALAMYRASASCALLDGILYLLSRPTEDYDWLDDVLRAAGLHDSCIAGISRPVFVADRLPAAATEARRAHTALGRSGEVARWATASSRWASIALDELVELVRDSPELALRRELPVFDELSALAWIEHHGDIRTAAAELGIHPNTLRYRIRRMQLDGVDLSDPTTRLVVWLRLRAAV